MEAVKLALAALVVAALWMLSGRRFRVEPRVPAALDDVDWFRDWPIDRAPYLTAAEWRN